MTTNNEGEGDPPETTPVKMVRPTEDSSTIVVDRDATMEIHVKTLAGTALTLQVRPSDTVESLKDQIREEWGAPTDQQRLAWNGTVLEEADPNRKRVLGDYDLEDGATVTLSLRIGTRPRPSVGGIEPTSDKLPVDTDGIEADTAVDATGVAVVMSEEEEEGEARGRKTCVVRLCGLLLLVLVVVVSVVVLTTTAAAETDNQDDTRTDAPSFIPSLAPTVATTAKVGYSYGRPNGVSFAPTIALSPSVFPTDYPDYANFPPSPKIQWTQETTSPTFAPVMAPTEEEVSIAPTITPPPSLFLTDYPDYAVIQDVPPSSTSDVIPVVPPPAASEPTYWPFVVLTVLVLILCVVGFLGCRRWHRRHKEENATQAAIAGDDPSKDKSPAPALGDVEKGGGVPTPVSPNPELLGVSVAWLKQGFLQEVRAAGMTETSTIYDLENLSEERNGIIRQKGKSIKCPVDGKMGAAYVHCFEWDKDKVGPATFMLSYSWGYAIGDIVDTLWDYCSAHHLPPNRTYIWMCCLCINQHRIAENIKNEVAVPFPHFKALFHSRVMGIGRLLAMMSPWDDPKYITRIWCIFELYTASLLSEDIKVAIVMPPREKKDMTRTIGLKGSEGIDKLYRTLGNTKVENAVASQEEDRENILKMVEQGPGFRALDVRVNDLLRQWVKESTMGVLNLLKMERNVEEGGAKKDESQWNNTSSNLRGEMIRSLELQLSSQTMATPQLSQQRSSFLREAIQSADLALSDSEFADFLSNFGILYERNGELNQALECQQLALSIYTEIGADDGAASSLTNIGSVLLRKGDLDEALEHHKKSLSLWESQLNVEGNAARGRERAASLNNIAAVLLEKGDYAGALEHCHQALIVVDGTAALPETAASFALEGSILFKQGDYKAALERSHKALSMQESILGMFHPDTAASYHQIGKILHQMHESDGLALEFYQNAVAIREFVLGSEHEDTMKSSEEAELLLWEIEGAKISDTRLAPRSAMVQAY